MLFGRTRVVSRDALLVVGSLAAFAAFAALSSLWATSTPLALLETERVLVYVAAAAAAALVVRADLLPVGVLAATVVLACWNLALRIRDAGEPYDLGNRGVLAEPVGYENALGVLAAAGIVLAVALRGVPAVRAASVVPLAAVVVSTGNRGAWLALAAGLLVVAAFDAGALRNPAAIACGAAAAALAAWTPTLEPEIAPSRAEDGALPLAIGLVGLTVVAASLARERSGAATTRRWILALVAPLVVVALVGAGGERHDYWRAALDQAQGAPLAGDGAGSFARHWLATRDVPFDVRDAHSLYLETLGELGVVGLALLIVAFAPPLRFAPRAPAAAGGLAVVLVHAGYDWDWEMPAVTLAALFCGVALARRGNATIALSSRAAAAGAAAFVALATLALVPFVGHAALAGADAAFRDNHVAVATERVDRAEVFLPWSQEPWFLEATILRQRGADAPARDALREALERDDSDARVWRALAEVSAGTERAQALERAEKLDPLGAPER